MLCSVSCISIWLKGLTSPHSFILKKQKKKEGMLRSEKWIFILSANQIKIL